jgi:hypothetical protein
VLPGVVQNGRILWLAIPSGIAAVVGIVALSLQFTLARMERCPADTKTLMVASA